MPLTIGRIWRVAALLILVLLSGCGSPNAEFQSNWVYVRIQEKSVGTKFQQEQVRNVQNVLAALFGTPDAPTLPQLDEVDYVGFIDSDKLGMSAGPVGTDENGRAKGLYRRHCAHCHGVTGDGAGPTAAFLNPYPRDYRLGIFKFKSTPRTEPPTNGDLMKTLYNGIPGTSMPSFKVLAQDELEALAHYVKYLSVRGQLERRLIAEVANELEEGELLVDMSKRADSPNDFNSSMDIVKIYATEILKKWFNSKDVVTPVPDRPAAIGGAEDAVAALRQAIRDQEDGKSPEINLESAQQSVGQLRDELVERGKPAEEWLAKLDSVSQKLASQEPDLAAALEAIKPIHENERERSIAKGRELFFTTEAACTKCHGTTALGDGQTTDFDDWTKQIEPKNPKAVREYISLGALKPRNIRPRNLRMGVFRGGRRPIDIFWRVHNGIAGSPMPAASLKKTPEAKGLTTDDLWHLVDYVRFMTYESISRPEQFEPTNNRERN